MEYFVHKTPGRLRVKIPSLKGNPMQCQEVRSIFESTAGAAQVVTNALTGSVTITYNPMRISEGNILSLLDTHGFMDMSHITHNDPYVEETMSKAGEVVQKAALGLVLDQLFAGTPLSLLTVLL